MMRLSTTLIVITCLLEESYAFVPASLTKNEIMRNSLRRATTVPFHKRRVSYLSNDKILSHTAEPQDDVNDILGQNLFEESIEVPLIPENTGPELFLDTISNSIPEDVFPIKITDQATSLFEDNSSSKSEDVVSIDITKEVTSQFEDNFNQEQPPPLTPSGNANILSGTEYADFSNSTVLNEDVKAVLDASEAAAVEAEASMHPDLIELLDFPATATSDAVNATTMSSPLIVEEIPEILSASDVVGEAVTSTNIETPSVSKILKFAIPAIGVWLCGPLLSLIDTSAVGLYSGTIQQAALNPAVAVTDYAALLIAFMYTGTTNLVAAAQESDRTKPDKPITTKAMIGSMQLSTFVGLGLGSFLFAFARPLLKAIIGNDAISPAVFSAAMKYVRIRALGMPAAAIIGSTQAACLGMQDIRSPLYVLVAAAVANFFGDFFFVGNNHPLIGGAAGAAWATVFSQYVGVALFVKWLCHKPVKKPAVMNLSNAIMEATGKPGSSGSDRRKGLQEAMEQFRVRSHIPKPRMPRVVGKIRAKLQSKNAQVKKDSFSVRGFLQDKFSARDLMKPPSSETKKQFAPYLIPVTTTQVGRVSGYIAMSHVVASSLGTISMAAQQVIVSLFYCLCPIADSLSLTAQSFLPAISEKSASRERSVALRKTAVNFIKAGGVFGAAMMAAVSAIPLLTGFFTADPAVVSMVNGVVPLLLAFFGVHGFLCSAEGLLLGQKDLNFLGKMYSGYFFVVPYLMLKVKKAALAGCQSANLFSVWKVFLGYQLFRFGAWIARVVQLQRRTHRDTEIAEAQLAADLAP